MGEPKRVDESGFITIRPEIFTSKEPEWYDLGISLHTYCGSKKVLHPELEAPLSESYVLCPPNNHQS